MKTLEMNWYEMGTINSALDQQEKSRPIWLTKEMVNGTKRYVCSLSRGEYEAIQDCLDLHPDNMRLGSQAYWHLRRVMRKVRDS